MYIINPINQIFYSLNNWNLCTKIQDIELPLNKNAISIKNRINMS